MAAVTSNRNQARARRVAVKRVEGFAKQFGEAHRNLARHAAFPLSLTPDLLYQIWANFAPEAPWEAVAHLLLSRLCRQVGYEMYEMDISDRNLLLRELKEQFGQERLDELAEFLLDYVAQRLTDDDPDTQDLREAQEWTALAYTKPNELARELAQRLSERVQQEDMGEVLRLASLAETFAEPLIEDGFEPLLTYVSAMNSFARGDLEKVGNQIVNLPKQGRAVRIAEVLLPIPPQIRIDTDKVQEKTGIISSDTIRKLLLLLRPHLQDENERKGYLIRTLGIRTDAWNLVWNQPSNIFIPNMLQELVRFGEIEPGKPSLCALLEAIREDVGINVQPDIDELLLQVNQELKTPTPNFVWKGVQTLKGHSELVRSVAISPNGQILASSSNDQTIKLWNLPTGKLLYTLAGHSSMVTSVAFSPDGKTLASASNLAVGDGNIKLWNVETGTLQQTLGKGLLNLRVSCVTFSPDGNTLASGNIDATIKLWQLNSGRLHNTLKGHGWDVNSVAFSRNGKILVSGGLDGAIKIWNWRTGELLHTLNRPSPSDIIGSLVSWFDSSVGVIWSVAISPDGQIIASGGSEQPIMLWNSETGKLVRILTGHSGRVNSVTFSPNGKLLASGGDDNTLRIWNYQTGELLQTLEHLSPVYCVTFSPDGQTLVGGSADSTIKLWRIMAA